MGTTFSASNAVLINKLQKQSEVNTKNTTTFTHISQIQKEHLNYLEIDNFSQNQIILNALRYNPEILATAAHHHVVLHS
jgi:hypothetical protein